MRRARTWSSVLPGAVARGAQITRFAAEWDAANAAARRAPGPRWVVLGDSTAQAIGASSIRSGYVGGVQAWLSTRDGVTWNVINLSRSGARVLDVLEQQVPLLREIGEPDLVSCAVGANDLLRRTDDLEGHAARLARELPAGTLFANLPRGLRERRSERLNRSLAALAAEHHLRLVDLWAATGPPWRGRFSPDHFHPNDAGYRSWTAAFVSALDPGGA